MGERKGDTRRPSPWGRWQIGILDRQHRGEYILMIWTIFVVLTLVGGVLIILQRAARGPSLTLETLQWPINGLLRQGYDGGFLIIDIDKSKYFLQLRKYIRRAGEYGILLSFPHAQWSNELFPKLVEFCESTGLAYSVEVEKAIEPLEFLHIDFGKDAAKAHDVVKGIILSVFKMDKNVKLFATLQNASIKDELVDRKQPS